MTVRRAKPSVLYLAAGNPAAPVSGMDVVVREHISELTALDQIDLTGIFVAPGLIGRHDPMAPIPWKNFTGFVGDLQNQTNPWIRALKKAAHVLSGGLLCHYGFLSQAARAAIRKELAQKPDLVIVDHAMAFANIASWDIKKNCARFILIAHDVTHHGLLDSARLKQSTARKIYYGLQALQVRLVEIYAIRSAALSVFLSEWDRRHFAALAPGKSISLCPALSASRPPLPLAAAADGRYEKNLVFIGSPGFPPNKFALDWIVKDLAPRLEKIDPAVTIVLVGKGTPQIEGANAKNINALGFVAEQDLAALLQTCLCVICPVAHGSGIKIKVLEAFAAGCPVFATAQSLRGFEFMDIAPRLDIADPAAAAHALAAFAGDPSQQAADRAHVRAYWDRHLAARRGQLNRIVMDLLKAPEKT